MQFKTLALTLTTLALTACGTSGQPQQAQTGASTASKAQCLSYLVDASLLGTYNEACPSNQANRFAAAAANAQAKYAQSACRNQVSESDIETAIANEMSQIRQDQNICQAVLPRIQRAMQQYSR